MLCKRVKSCFKIEMILLRSLLSIMSTITIIIITRLGLRKISSHPVYLGKTFKITLGKELQIWRITKMKSIPLQENRYLQSTKCIRAPSFPQVFWRQEDRFPVKISKEEFLIHHFAKIKKTIKYQTNG